MTSDMAEDDVLNLVAAYISIWNERDDRDRRAILDGVFTDNAVYVDPNLEARGRSAIDAYINGWQAQSPGLTFRLGDVRSHHDVAHFDWRFGPPTGSPVASGWDAVVLVSRRISKVYGFFR